MGIDKETTPYFNIWVNKDAKLLKRFEERHEEEVGKEEHKENPQYIMMSDMFSVETKEYYFDEESDSILYSGGFENGNSISFQIKLSDEVMVDILQHAIRKLNKLKTALESLK